MTTHLSAPAPDTAPVTTAGTAPPDVRQATAPAGILTRKAIPAILVAAGGALAYSISKIDLAFRGELGLPGFTAPAASYQTHDAFTGQLANAGLGLAMAVGILLLAVPKRRWLQIVLLVLNGAGALMIGVSTVLFGARALGIAPALGTPAEGVSTWLSVGVGLIWSVAWGRHCAQCAPRGTRREMTPLRTEFVRVPGHAGGTPQPPRRHPCTYPARTLRSTAWSTTSSSNSRRSARAPTG